MQQYDITVKSSQSFTINAAGRYIKYLSGNNGGGDVSLAVTPGNAGATKTVLVPGQALRLGAGSATPSSWTLSNNAGGATITGSVVIGDGQIDDPTINGTVQVVDGGKQRTLSGNAFLGYSYVQAAANQYPQVQLWNPPTNSNRLVVEQLSISGFANGEAAFISFSNATISGASIGAGQAKKSGAVASPAQMYVATPGALPVTTLFALNSPVNGSTVFKFSEPVILLPGYGLTVTNSNSTNTAMGAAFEWYEEPNV